MSSFNTLQNYVGLKPFKFKHDETKTAEANSNWGGFSSSDRLMNDLVSTEVLFDSASGFKAGDIVFFKSEVHKFPDFSRIHKADNKDFLLVPSTHIVAVLKKT